MDETRTAPHRAATRPQEALPDDAFELVGAGWREHRPALRRPGRRQRLARLPLLPLGLLLLLVLGCLCAPWLANHDPAEFYLADRNTRPAAGSFSAPTPWAGTSIPSSGSAAGPPCSSAC